MRETPIANDSDHDIPPLHFRVTARLRPSREAPTPSDQVSQLEDVVVTAKRRYINLHTTAVAAAILGGEYLQDRRINNIEALHLFMPSVTVENSRQTTASTFAA